MQEQLSNSRTNLPCFANRRDDKALSLPERELLEFIRAVANLIPSDETGMLTQLWLDEVASMECMLEPASPLWRLVTLRASARLAERLVALHCERALS
jgi:hypothetical protein